VSIYSGPGSAQIADQLPNDPERWVYRVQATDERGRPSPEYWVIPAIIRIPQSYRPVPPQMSRLRPTDVNEMSLRVSIPDRDEVPAVLLFTTSVANQTTRELDARLLSVPNRPDLDPVATHRVETQDGDVIAPVQLDPAAADRNDDELFWDISVVNPAGSELQAWAISVNAAGVSSTLVGPRRHRIEAR
jgi:hypothetical protein